MHAHSRDLAAPISLKRQNILGLRAVIQCAAFALRDDRGVHLAPTGIGARYPRPRRPVLALA